MLVTFSSAEVLCYLEPDGVGSWSVFTALHTVCGFIALFLANVFFFFFFPSLSFFFLNKRLLYSLILEAFSVFLALD